MSQKSRQKTLSAIDILPVDDAIYGVEDGDSIDSVESSDPGDVYDAGYFSNWFLEILMTTVSQYNYFCQNQSFNVKIKRPFSHDNQIATIRFLRYDRNVQFV